MSGSRKHAIVTGAASGLGRALALRLARDGWEIAVCDINRPRAEETLAQVRQAGGEGRVEIFDCTKFDQWQALRDRLQQDWPQLDLLCNNAGVAVSGDVGVSPLEDWRWIMDANLWNGIYGCHVMIPWMKENPHGGHIINTASLAAIGSAPGMASYNVTKAGMLALSETLYSELAPSNIGVTVLCPGFFKTNLLESGRFGRPELEKMAKKAFEKSDFTAADVAEAAVRAMQRRQLYVVLPRQGRMYWYLKRLSPTRFFKLISKEWQRQQAKAVAEVEGDQSAKGAAPTAAGAVKPSAVRH